MATLALKPVVLVPTDMSDPSLPAVTYAADLTRRVGGTMILFHVISPKEVEEAVADGVYVDKLIDNLRAELLWWFATFVPLEIREKISVQTMAAIGHPEQEILAAAESIRAGMIVMATHGRTGLQRALLGSVAEAVVRQARCPVLTIRTLGVEAVPVGRGEAAKGGVASTTEGLR